MKRILKQMFFYMLIIVSISAGVYSVFNEGKFDIYLIVMVIIIVVLFIINIINSEREE